MAGLAALGVNGVAELRLVPAAERIQVIEQHRDAEAAPARLGPAGLRRTRGCPRRIYAHVCRRRPGPGCGESIGGFCGELVSDLSVGFDKPPLLT